MKDDDGVPIPDTRRADAKACVERLWPGTRTHDEPMTLWLALDDIKRRQPKGLTSAQIIELACAAGTWRIKFVRWIPGILSSGDLPPNIPFTKAVQITWTRGKP